MLRISRISKLDMTNALNLVAVKQKLNHMFNCLHLTSKSTDITELRSKKSLESGLEAIGRTPRENHSTRKSVSQMVSSLRRTPTDAIVLFTDRG